MKTITCTLALLAGVAVSCGNSGAPQPGSGGTSGSSGSGGTSATVGTASSGGRSELGNSSGTGGTPGIGGVNGSGGSSANTLGGAPASGGSSGKAGTGGSTAATGGSLSTTMRTGGNPGIGGSVAGGAQGSGGASNGGASASTGGKATGGMSSAVAGGGSGNGGAGAGGTTPGATGGVSAGGASSTGTGGSTACVVPSGPPTSTPIQFNDNGGWCWYQDERAVVDTKGNKLLIGSVASGGSRNGYIEAVVYDLAAGSKKLYTVSTKLTGSVDDHNAPAFVVRPDGNYVAQYCGHRVDCITRLSIFNGSAWSAESTFNWAGSGCPWAGASTNMVTYSNPW